MIRKETDKSVEMTLHTEGLHTSDILLLGAVRKVKKMSKDVKDVNSNTFYSKLQ